LRNLALEGGNALFEGAQGAMLDIDLGTYPFVTSSNTTVGGALAGTGVGPTSIDYVLGIVKAYATRVGAGPFPTELRDDVGEHLSRVGAEFGATTGRARRCGWFDAVLLKRAVFTNGLTGLCVTKLDVLDGLEEVKICVGYRLDGEISASPPLLTDRFAECEPVYESLPGWAVPTSGATSFAALPREARNYLERLEGILGVPIDAVSTGPSRDAIVIRRHPFE
jgi:adenylosuccinate synthase